MQKRRQTHSGGGVGEVSLGHEVVGLDGLLPVFAVDSTGDSHQHVLRSLSNSSVDSQQVTPLERLETEAVKDICCQQLVYLDIFGVDTAHKL